MKKLFLIVLLQSLFFPAMSQGLMVYISGTVTDIATGYPLPGQAVTILSDSTNGFFYSNTVYTDSTGHYADSVPVISDSTGILYVRTIDCDNIMHQFAIFYSPANNTFTQDFQICSANVSCQAQFSYYPDPEGSPDSFQFIDQSTGNFNSWQWDFGDNTYSGEQNPVHLYPGPGTYNACLTITGNDCTSMFCQEIIISDTVYHQLYGQVFAGNFPLQTGAVALFVMNANGGYTPFGDAFSVDSNGVFYFTLVPDGIYLIQAIPFDSSSYLPTYFDDVINWQLATQVVPDIPDNPYNINLIPAGMMTPGPGSVSGQINASGLRNSMVEKINMILMDETGPAIGFCKVSGQGEFSFPALDYGIYYLRAELPGVTCDNLKFEITADNPHADVILTFSGNSILAVDDTNPAKELVVFYPNPFDNLLNISMNLAESERIDIEIYGITGQLVYQASESIMAGNNTFSVSFSNIPPGLYTIRVYAENVICIMKKIIKTD